MMRVVLATTAALLAFAANSLLCRAALGGGVADAASFTAVRLVSGAAVLLLLCRSAGGARGGSWPSAVALFVYAAAFSFAYFTLSAGVGALLLAPIAVFQILRLQTRPLVRSDRVRLWIVFLLSVAVWLISIPISWLFLIRFIQT